MRGNWAGNPFPGRVSIAKSFDQALEEVNADVSGQMAEG